MSEEKDREFAHFDNIVPGRTLSSNLIEQLVVSGFVVIPGPIAHGQLSEFAAAFDEVMHAAASSGVGLAGGGSLIRMSDFVNSGPLFDEIYVYAPLLEACKTLIGEPFKLSAFVGRTLRPQTAAQNLHADLPRTSNAAPMVGFIQMIDDFCSDNGATRFVPTSQSWPDEPVDRLLDPGADCDEQILACGAAGGMIIFNAAIWHGHTANQTTRQRRSLQGYFVRRDAKPGLELSRSVRAETLERISHLGRYLLAV